MTQFQKGQYVAWSWGNGEGTGQIKEHFKEKVTRKIAGTEVTRNASDDNPAYLIEQEDGSEVLKSESELKKAN